MTAGASTPKGERRRAALVDAAAALLTEGGFEAVRHRAVAERAGLPLASTTYYFDSLDDLVAAAVEHQSRTEQERGRRCLEELATRDRDVDALVDLMLELLLGPEREDSHADAEAVLLRYERLVATGRREYLRPLMRTLSAELKVLLGEILARSGKRVDDAEIARLIALTDGAVVNALVAVDPEPRAAAARMLHDALGPPTRHHGKRQ